jgi:hypothetical protein
MPKGAIEIRTSQTIHSPVLWAQQPSDLTRIIGSKAMKATGKKLPRDAGEKKRNQPIKKAGIVIGLHLTLLFLQPSDRMRLNGFAPLVVQLY